MKIGRSINNCRVHGREITGEVQLIWAKHVLAEPKALQSMQECRFCYCQTVMKFHTWERDNLPAGKEREGCLYGTGDGG